ncbi:MAG: pyridoxamine 5'-phosphate oxidase family protein [Roseiflexaceae bacterium]
MQYATSFSEIEAEFVERAHTAVWCNGATIDPQGRPRSRVLHPLWEGATGWITTGRHSTKARHFAAHPYLSLAYVADPFKPVYAECHVAWEDDQATKRRVWDLFKHTPPPLGFDPAIIWPDVDNPEFGLLRLTPWRIELYDLMNQANRRIWQTGA